MKILKLLPVIFVLAALTFSWSIPTVRTQDYYTQDDQNKKILKEAVVGAGTGAIASGASGGSAGKGALIGAGTNVIGNALLDTLTSQPAPQPQPQIQYVQQVQERGYNTPIDAPRRGGCGSGSGR